MNQKEIDKVEESIRSLKHELKYGNLSKLQYGKNVETLINFIKTLKRLVPKEYWDY